MLARGSEVFGKGESISRERILLLQVRGDERSSTTSSLQEGRCRLGSIRLQPSCGSNCARKRRYEAAYSLAPTRRCCSPRKGIPTTLLLATSCGGSKTTLSGLVSRSST